MGTLDVVDENDKVIGQASFEDCHTKRLRHRGTCVHIFRDESMKEVLVQRRGLGMRTEPGKRHASACGHVDAGETYKIAALREMEEEIFHEQEAPDLKIKSIGKFVLTDRPLNIEFVKIFYTVHPGPFSGHPEEVESLEFVEIEALKKDMHEHPEKYCVGYFQEVGLLDTFLRKHLNK